MCHFLLKSTDRKQDGKLKLYQDSMQKYRDAILRSAKVAGPQLGRILSPYLCISFCWNGQLKATMFFVWFWTTCHGISWQGLHESNLLHSITFLLELIASLGRMMIPRWTRLKTVYLIKNLFRYLIDWTKCIGQALASMLHYTKIVWQKMNIVSFPWYAVCGLLGSEEEIQNDPAALQRPHSIWRPKIGHS